LRSRYELFTRSSIAASRLGRETISVSDVTRLRGRCKDRKDDCIDCFLLTRHPLVEYENASFVEGCAVLLERFDRKTEPEIRRLDLGKCDRSAREYYLTLAGAEPRLRPVGLRLGDIEAIFHTGLGENDAGQENPLTAFSGKTNVVRIFLHHTIP